jgi:hypothetical protein
MRASASGLNGLSAGLVVICLPLIVPANGVSGSSGTTMVAVVCHDVGGWKATSSGRFRGVIARGQRAVAHRPGEIIE